MNKTITNNAPSAGALIFGNTVERVLDNMHKLSFCNIARKILQRYPAEELIKNFGYDIRTNIPKGFEPSPMGDKFGMKLYSNAKSYHRGEAKKLEWFMLIEKPVKDVIFDILIDPDWVRYLFLDGKQTEVYNSIRSQYKKVFDMRIHYPQYSSNAIELYDNKYKGISGITPNRKLKKS